ncbi:MAG: adaptor protein MecA [Clostridia bacterium]|nr:adaptor protein MecA [Clostridia bacterium]
MKFLRIGLNKLKVSLTPADCEYYGITRGEDPDSFDKKEVREAVFCILAEAKERCGFDIADEKVLIQLYPSEEGACELFVTKLGTLTARERDEVTRSSGVTCAECVTNIFRFSELDTLLRGVRALTDKTLASDLFIDSGGAYYIRVKENTIDGRSSVLPLFEFGDKIPELPYDIEGERGRLLCRGEAIAKLSKL